MSSITRNCDDLRALTVPGQALNQHRAWAQERLHQQHQHGDGGGEGGLVVGGEGGLVPSAKPRQEKARDHEPQTSSVSNRSNRLRGKNIDPESFQNTRLLKNRNMTMARF